MPTTRALALFAALPLVVLASRRTPPTEEECKARLDGIYADIEAGDTGWRVGTHPGPIPLL